MPFLESIQGMDFEIYQINGTKYYKNFRPCPVKIKEELEQCKGEIFLSKIPEHATADQIAQIACLLGEMYILRFKVNFAGESRGFAYLQYMDPTKIDFALESLPYLFRAHGFKQIRAKRSKNTSKLVLKHSNMSRREVCGTLAQLCNYRECNMRTLRDNQVEYQLIFGSNEDAVKARRTLIGQICIFGPSASIAWDVNANKQ